MRIAELMTIEFCITAKLEALRFIFGVSKILQLAVFALLNPPLTGVRAAAAMQKQNVAVVLATTIRPAELPRKLR